MNFVEELKDKVLAGGKVTREEALELVEKTGVIVVPGTAFGDLGEGYVRFALVYPVETIEGAVQAIAESGMLNP